MNTKITLSWEYEDKYGGSGHGSEDVYVDINDMINADAKIMEAVGRMEKHMGDFISAAPMEEEEVPTESESYRLAH